MFKYDIPTAFLLIVSFLLVYFSNSVSGVPPHRALMFAAWNVLAARKLKSTGKFCRACATNK